MSRREQYKQGPAGEMGKSRKKRRQKETELRKHRREKILNSKRVRHSSINVGGDIDDDEFIAEQVELLAKEIQKPNPEREQQLKTLRKMFAQGSDMVEAFLGVDNSLNKLIGILSGNEPELQLEAVWCVANISAGEHEHTKLVSKMAAPYLITYLSGQNPKLQDQCAWALGNMAGDEGECRDTLLSQGILQPLVNLLKSTAPNVVQSAAFALSNLARGQGANTSILMEAGIVPLLLKHLVITKENMAVLSEVAWVLTYLAARKEHEPALVSEGIIPKLVDLLVQLSKQKPHHAQAVTPLLRCLGNICSGPDEYSAMATENGTLMPALHLYLNSDHRHIKKETLWVLTNMTGGVESICECVLTNGILPDLIQLLQSTFDIKNEAALCLCNLAHHGEKYCEELLNYGAFPYITTMLKSHDPDLVMEALWFSEMMLRMTKNGRTAFGEGSGVGFLEALEYHSNDTIKEQAHQLLDTYFYEDKEKTTENLEENEELPLWRIEAQKQQSMEQD